MLDARLSNMQAIATYSRARVALLGVGRIFFGLLVLLIGAVAFIGDASGDSASRQPGDMPQWWMMLVGVGLTFYGIVLATGGVGRLVSVFASNCYFMAGPEGLAVRAPKVGWFGRFKVLEYHHKWEEIENIYPFTRSINFIPISRELHIRLFGGKDIAIERANFSESSKRLCAILLGIRAQAGK